MQKRNFSPIGLKMDFFRAFYSCRRHLEFFSWATLRDFFSVIHSTIKNLNIAFSTKIANNAISDQTTKDIYKYAYVVAIGRLYNFFDLHPLTFSALPKSDVLVTSMSL